jgi:hypothetical protein
MPPVALGIVLREVIARNRIGYGIAQIAVTGCAARPCVPYVGCRRAWS